MKIGFACYFQLLSQFETEFSIFCTWLARDPNPYPLCSLRLWCLLVQGQVKMLWRLPSQACCSLIEDNFFSLAMSSECWLTSWLVFMFLPAMQQQLRMEILYNGLPYVWADYYVLIYTHHWELMRSVGTHGSLSWLLMEKTTVWHFVGNSEGYDCTHCHVIFEVLIYLQSHIYDLSRYLFYLLVLEMSGQWLVLRMCQPVDLTLSVELRPVISSRSLVCLERSSLPEL